MTYYTPPSNDDTDFVLFSLDEKDNDAANLFLAPPFANDVPTLSDISITTTSQESVATTESVSEINPSSVSVSSIISVGEETVLDISNANVEIENESIVGKISGINATENDLVGDVLSDSKTASTTINDISRNISAVTNSSLTSFYEVPTGGIWEDSEYNEFDWQPSPPNTPYVVTEQARVDTLDNAEEIEISKNLLSANVSSTLVDEEPTFRDLIWNQGSLGVRSWQTSPPETPFLQRTTFSAQTLSDTSLEITDSAFISSGTLESISDVEALTFDRLIWDIQSWNKSSWQTSPPEYPFLTLTDIVSSTLDANNVSVSTSPFISQATFTTPTSTEDVVFDRLSWDIQSWGNSSWQTSPPEYPELSLISISAPTFDNAESNIVVSGSISTISSTTFTSTETEDLDDGSWETGLWDRFDWTLDVTTRIDRGEPEEIFSSSIQPEETSSASIIALTDAFAVRRYLRKRPRLLMLCLAFPQVYHHLL